MAVTATPNLDLSLETYLTNYSTQRDADLVRQLQLNTVNNKLTETITLANTNETDILTNTAAIAALSTAPITYSLETGMTADPGGGQNLATHASAITEEISNITTCATAHDSVTLPAAAAGNRLIIKNSGATSLDIFPLLADSIDALAVNLAVTLAPGAVGTFFAIDGTVWESDIDDALTLNSPTTVSGQLRVVAADSAGDFITTVTHASQAAARTYTIPDGGASANFVLTQNAGIQTIATGDVALSDGSVTITDADDAASLAITNAALLTGDLATMTIANQTSGNGLVITGGGANLLTGGSLGRLDMGAATAGSGLEILSTGDYVGTDGLLNIAANTATTGEMGIVMSATAQTTGNLISLTGGGATLATGGSLITGALGAATAGSGLELSTTGDYVGTDGLINLAANTATTGDVGIVASATSQTTGNIISLTGGGATLATGGSLITGNLGAATAGSGLELVTTGDYVGTDGLVNITANTATTGDIGIVASATAQTTGNIISLVGGGATLASGGSLIRGDMGAATAGSGLELVSTGAYVDAADGLLNITANTATTGTLAVINGTSLTTGLALDINSGGGRSIEAAGSIEGLYFLENKYCVSWEFDKRATAGVTLAADPLGVVWDESGTNTAAAHFVQTTAGTHSGGALVITTAVANDDSDGATSQVPILTSDNPIMEFRFKVDDVAGGAGVGHVICGLGLTEAAFAGNWGFDNLEVESDDFFFVGMNSDLATPALVRLSSSNNGDAVAATGDPQTLGVSLSADTYCTVRMDFSTLAAPRIWVDVTGGVLTSAHEIPNATIQAGTAKSLQGGITMYPFIGVQTVDVGGANAATLTVDYMKVWVDRGA